MTEFDDPFKPPDATVLRPRPGAGRRGSADPPTLQAQSSAHVEAVPVAALDELGLGLNPLVRAASTLLLLAGQLRGTLAGPDIPTLRRHTLDEIRRFEDRARAGGVQNEVVLAARYALCAALDEAVLSTPWGAQSEWAQQTLLVALHREAWGGEKFFEMLDRVSQEPRRHVDLMELQYLCLAFGFAGKYQVSDRGHSQLSDVQHDLYRRIRDHRGASPTDLSLRWQGLQDRRNPIIKYVPWWVVGAAALAILALVYTTLLVRLGTTASPVKEGLAKVGLEGFTRPGPEAAITGPSLKSLLEKEVAAGVLAVAEEGGKTTVTLRGEVFGSATATINPAYLETLRSITAALNRVPGRVLVKGHTDDQPVRPGRFRDNFDLSRQRAVNVATILKAGIDNAGRLQHTGVGSAEPLDPANRALNRRVEIVHVRGS